MIMHRHVVEPPTAVPTAHHLDHQLAVLQEGGRPIEGIFQVAWEDQRVVAVPVLAEGQPAQLPN